MQTNGDKVPGLDRAPGRYTAQEAANLLDPTIGGVRSRIKRGTLDSLRVDGKVYILLGEPDTAQASDRAPKCTRMRAPGHQGRDHL